MIEARHGSAGARRAMGFGDHLGPPSPATVIEERHGSAGTRRAMGVWGPSRGPHLNSHRGAPRLRRDATSDGGLGAISGPPSQQSSRSATAPPGRDERRGVWGPSRGPHLNSHRGAPRLRRGATSDGGVGGHLGPPSPATGDREAPRLRRGATSDGGLGAISGPHHLRRVIEERHGSAGARRAMGGLGAISGPHHLRRVIEKRHGSAGARRA